MRLIAGLGNPGFRFRHTRHNVGFLLIDRLSKKNSIRLKKREYNSLLGTGKIAGEQAILMKPITFMNLSGRAVVEVVTKEELTLEKLMVVCDDIDLELGSIRIRTKGSSGGHRGLDSIIEGLGTEEFPRLRIGIGRRDKNEITRYVLAPFRRQDLNIINSTIDKTIQALDCWIKEGIDIAMSRFNACPV